MSPVYTAYEYAKRGLRDSYETFKLDVERSKGAPQIEAEVLIFYHVKWGSRRVPRIRSLCGWWLSWLCFRFHVMKPLKDAQEAPWLLCPSSWDCQGLCSCCQSSALHSQSPSGSHMGDRSSYLQIDSVTCIILQASPPEPPAPTSNNLAIHVAEPLAHFFTMCLVVCVSGPCVTQWNGRWDRCQEPGVFALSQTRDLGKVIWLSSVSPPPLSFMWNTP